MRIWRLVMVELRVRMDGARAALKASENARSQAPVNLTKHDWYFLLLEDTKKRRRQIKRRTRLSSDGLPSATHNHGAVGSKVSMSHCSHLIDIGPA